MNVKYLRVSTEKQDLRRQEEALKDIKADKVYKDKITGTTTDRPALNKLRLEVKAGDVIYCESISRLGRSVLDIKNLVEEFETKKVSIHFVREGIITGNGNGNSHVNFLLNILSSFAELERETITERVRAGIAKAKLYGTKTGRPLGRPPVTLPKDFERIYKLWKTQKITGKDAIKMLDISRPTIYAWSKKFEEENPTKAIAGDRKHNSFISNSGTS